MAPRILCAFLAAAFAFAGFGGTDADFDFDRRYAGAAGALVLPQGGGDLRRLGGGALRAGYYFTDTVALDGEVAVLENKVGLAVRGLWHLQGFEEFGRLFGYERFDPFVTAGAPERIPERIVPRKTSLPTRSSRRAARSRHS